MSKRISATVLTSVLLMAFAAGCKKKPPIATAPPPPAPPTTTTTTTATDTSNRAPVIAQFTAEPSSIERGQAATLRWSVSDATSVSIEPGLGPVQTNGSRQVFPSSTTTYRLTASGAAGNASGSATVNVTVPQAPPAPPPPSVTSFTQAVEGTVGDAYFDYDSSDIREDGRNTLSRNSDAIKKILQDFPSARLMVEGHCDERGSGEYNLGLADRRATAAKEFLVQLGVPADRLLTISYGKERPQCQEPNESCWQKNRRAHFAAGQ